MRHPDPNFGYPSLSLLENEQIFARLKQKPSKNVMRRGTYVLDSYIDSVTWEEAVNRIADWGAERQSRYVTLCNVHSVVTASQDPKFAAVINQADMAAPDGAPIAWMLRKEGFPEQQRVNGPDLMWQYLGEAERRGQSVFFYGSSDTTLSRLQARLVKHFPALKIVGMVSPPFRALSTEEDAAYVDQINQSGAAVVFVGLGCPKQEFWMAAHRGAIKAVMLGVGAAFDYHAGTLRRAPTWMQHRGFEWLYRFATEPRRLARRYLETNSLFVAKVIKRILLGQGPKDQKI